MRIRYFIVSTIVLLLLVLVLVQCTDKYPEAHKELNLANKDGCVNCHLNANLLKKVATPLPPKEGNAGEG